MCYSTIQYCCSSTSWSRCLLCALNLKSFNVLNPAWLTEIFFVSGSAMTPMFFRSKSPMLRVIASLPLTFGCPRLFHVMKPPLFLILCEKERRRERESERKYRRRRERDRQREREWKKQIDEQRGRNREERKKASTSGTHYDDHGVKIWY